MKKISLLMAVLLLTGCSFSAIEMARFPTVQIFDLSDPEGDGVISARDECPDSSSGAEINNNGCGTETIETIRHELSVNFDKDSAEVTPDHYSEIEELANFLNAYPLTKVTIEGHTSIVGSAVYNKGLSLRRAEAIKAILIDKYHVNGNMITTIGYGAERPLLIGNNEYVHAKNRRIMVEFFGQIRIKDLKWTIYSVDDRDK